VKLTVLTIAVMVAAIALLQTAAQAAGPTPEETIRDLIARVPLLTHPREGAIPIRASRLEGWLPEDDEEAREVLLALDARGLALCSRVTPGNEEGMTEAMRMSRLQQELGLEVGVHASRAMYSFFNGDESTAHLADDGTAFFDDSFSSRKMGCPFRLDHRKDEIKEQFRSFLEPYRDADIEIDFLYLDWEIDGPIEWNGAWEHSKRCTVCREHIPDIDDFGAFQAALREIRSALQRECCVEVVQEYFPQALIGNYSVNPHGGTRYWYDYYEKLSEGAPHIADQLAKYRPWYHEFEPSGYTFANPVAYTWYATWSWYPAWESDDYRWFYNLLKVGTNAGEHTPQEVPLVTWVHWNTTAPPADAPPVPQMSEWAYQEMLWHLFLRGTDGLMMWCRGEETTKEVSLMVEVLDGMLGYREFLGSQPVLFHVPDRPGTVVSGLRLGDRLLVRRTDFGDNPAPVTRRIAGREVTIPATPGQCQVIDLSACPPAQ